jgi:nucleotide-binding universal stress UspA family protein
VARIVVGVDGSEHSSRAVRWAVDEARLRGADLQLVHAVSRHEVPAYPTAAGPSATDLEEAGRRLLDQTMDEVERTVDTGSVRVERTADTGSPAKRLCRAAEGADLLVMGARGLGGFRGLLLGSVTQQVVAHAPCPVVVVVPEDR